MLRLTPRQVLLKQGVLRRLTEPTESGQSPLHLGGLLRDEFRPRPLEPPISALKAASLFSHLSTGDPPFILDAQAHNSATLPYTESFTFRPVSIGSSGLEEAGFVEPAWNLSHPGRPLADSFMSLFISAA